MDLGPLSHHPLTSLSSLFNCVCVCACAHIHNTHICQSRYIREERKRTNGSGILSFIPLERVSLESW